MPKYISNIGKNNALFDVISVNNHLFLWRNNNLQDSDNWYLKRNELNVPNGVCGLDGTGKIPVSRLPIAAMTIEGGWNASTNTPQLYNGQTNYDPGAAFICTHAGTVNFGSGPVRFEVNEVAIYRSDYTWFKIGELLSLTDISAVIKLANNITDPTNHDYVLFDPVNETTHRLSHNDLVNSIPRIVTVGASFSNMGNAIPVGSGAYTSGIEGTIIRWNIISDTNANVTISIDKDGNNIIGSGNAPYLSNETARSEAVSNWSDTSLANDSVLKFGITANNNATFIQVKLFVRLN